MKSNLLRKQYVCIPKALLLACAETYPLANRCLFLSASGIVVDRILLAKCTGISCIMTDANQNLA